MKRNSRWLAALAGLAFAIAPLSFAQDNAPQPKGDGAVKTESTAPITDNNKPEHFGTRNPRYLIQPGDSFELQFEFSPEYNQSVSVQPDGFVTLRGVGDIHVANKTVPELNDLLKQQYGKFLANPVITIVLKDFQKPYFTAQGQVQHPGKYELRGDTTLVEALAIAGGFNTEYAKHSQVILFRRVNQDFVEAKSIDVKEMLANKNLHEDLHLQPGDMIYVPQNKISKLKRWIPYTAFNMGAGAF